MSLGITNVDEMERRVIALTAERDRLAAELAERKEYIARLEARTDKQLTEGAAGAIKDQDRIGKLAEALRKYGQHDFWGCASRVIQCGENGVDKRLPCTCGFDEVFLLCGLSDQGGENG